MSYVVSSVSPSDYLRAILDREAVDNGSRSVFRDLAEPIEALCSPWAGRYLQEVYPVGGFEKSQANSSRISIDFIVSLNPLAPYRIDQIYRSLMTALRQQGHDPVRRDVSIGFVYDGVGVDLIPAKRESTVNDVHEIYSVRRDEGIKTNLGQHILDAAEARRNEEVRVLKLWRDQNALDFPSYYLELTVEAALRRRPYGDLADNVWAVLGYLETSFAGRAVLDPANAGNIVSDEITMKQKREIASAAAEARSARPWSQIVA